MWLSGFVKTKRRCGHRGGRTFRMSFRATPGLCFVKRGAHLIDALNDAIVINRQVEMTLKSNQNGLLIFCLVQKIGEPGF
jgi:hypothetical protein